MNENSTNTELLIQYLDGELQGEDFETLNKNLANDQSLREEFENLKLAKEAMRSYGLKIKVGAIHGDMMRELKGNKEPRAKVIKMIIQYGIRVAVVLTMLVGISALYQYLTTSPEKLFSENYRPYIIHTMRGVPGSSVLSEKYKMGNMDSVIMEFKSLRSPQPEDYILAGIAFLEDKQPAKAIETFQTLIQENTNSKTDYFEDDAEYYLAMSYLSNQEPEKGLPFFEKIQADSQNPYNSKVSEWFLLKLKSLHVKN
jgi:tetratricopeptide (TPR) repeat protein